MQIGEVARETGLTVDAIRFYERRGLLREPGRSGGGFRLYVDTDVSALRFIRRMQALGFRWRKSVSCLRCVPARSRAPKSAICSPPS